MQRGIGRLRARNGSVYDADASAWAAAVTAAGGTYSASTLSAVSAFCVSAKANNYWTKLIRVNLFCGDQLTAARVPLKVGGGNSIDTNVGFVSGNYTEATGITGNGSTKYLKTGLVPSTALTLNNTHVSAYNRSSAAASGGSVIGASDTSTFQLLGPFTDSTLYSDQYNTSGRVTAAITGPFGHVGGSRTASNAHAVYKNGSSLASSTGSGGSLPAVEFYVFSTNNSGTPGSFVSYVLAGYSIGAGMSSTDMGNFYTDMQTFQTALGRNV